MVEKVKELKMMGDKKSGCSLICVECDDVVANYFCKQCQDPYCDLCFRWLHNKGTRASHSKDVLVSIEDKASTGRTFMYKSEEDVDDKMDIEGKIDTDKTSKLEEIKENTDNISKKVARYFDNLVGMDYSKLKIIAKFIPLRVTDNTRAMLKLLEGALDVSEYTDNVDVSSDSFGWRVGGKTQIMREELNNFFSLISGLLLAGHYKKGKAQVTGRTFEDNSEFFQNVFEIGRRYKISNSDKMRSTYGKMLHILQDAVRPGLLPFNPKISIKTVDSFLQEKKCLQILLDPDMKIACAEISTASMDSTISFSSEVLKEMSSEKIKARDRLLSKYVEHGVISEGDVMICIDSLADYNSHIISNRHPVDKMIGYLKKYFDPTKCENTHHSLRIRGGKGGSKLSHDHATQYQFVLQSLTLWREVMNDLFELWIYADEDMLSEDTGYRLRNTGQGLNRMQSLPYISRKMQEILSRVQRRVGRGRWVGLSVVHLGDRDVPNALFFIDKYTQVPRILSPLVNVLEKIDMLQDDPTLKRELIDGVFGDVEGLKRFILVH